MMGEEMISELFFLSLSVRNTVAKLLNKFNKTGIVADVHEHPLKNSQPTWCWQT